MQIHFVIPQIDNRVHNKLRGKKKIEAIRKEHQESTKEQQWGDSKA